MLMHSILLNMIISDFLELQRKPGRMGRLRSFDTIRSGSADPPHIFNKKCFSDVAIESKEDHTEENVTFELENLDLATPHMPTLCDDESLLDSCSSEDNDMQRGRKNFITPKLVATLDRCKLSTRDAVYIIDATAEALGHNTTDLVINKTSINRVRRTNRKEHAEAIKLAFKNTTPAFLTVHWDGKLLPALNVRYSKEERLPIVASFGDCEQLLAVPKLKNSTGREQANAVYNALIDWEITKNVEFLCFDTTASNTGRLNGACVLIEQKLNKDLIYLPCRHHIYELVLRSVFEAKISQSVKSPNIPLFEEFRANWIHIDPKKVESGRKYIEKYCSATVISELMVCYNKLLEGDILRCDYRELVELCVLFLNADSEKKYKIGPPGAMHHARWMAKSIYSLKMFLLRSQLDIKQTEKEGLKYICIFIVKVFVKPWMNCSNILKAPYQDLTFLKSLKKFEEIDKSISEAALKKFTSHMWYLSESLAAFSLFDNTVSIKTKLDMVKNLDREYKGTGKRFISTNEVNLYGKYFSVHLKNFDVR